MRLELSGMSKCLGLAAFMGSLIIFPLKTWANEKVFTIHPESITSVISQITVPIQPSLVPPPSPPASVERPIQLKLPAVEPPQPVETPKLGENSSNSEPDTIKIDGFIFENEKGELGKLVFSQKELEEVIHKRVKLDFSTGITFAQLLQIRSALTEFYVEKGYITSGAYIPEESLQSGKVRIRIVEGRLEKNGIGVHFTDEKHHLTEGSIRSRFSIREPLQKQNLIEALQILQLDPVIDKVDAELLPGVNAGTNILKLTITEKPLSCTFPFKFFSDSSACVLLQIATDNSRSPSVGSTRRQLKLNLFPGGGTDLGLTYTNTTGSNALDLVLALPLDDQNEDFHWSRTLTVRYNNTRNNIIERPFNRLDINSVSRYLDISLRQSKYLSTNSEFAFSFSGTWQQSETSLLGIGLPLSRDADEEGETRVLALRGSAEWNRRWLRSALALRGEVSVGTNIAPKEPFLILRGQGQWFRLLSPDTLFLVKVNTQFSSQTLPALEQITFGGQDTLRGYRQNFLLADNGVNASLELQFPILRPKLFGSSGVIQLVPFVDFATAWNYSKEDRLRIPSYLWSTGVGLQVRLGEQFRARVDWGFPLVTSNSGGTSLPQQNTYFSISGTLAF